MINIFMQNYYFLFDNTVFNLQQVPIGERWQRSIISIE